MTPQQIRERNEAWARALDENPLKAVGQMRDGDGGRCCLAVAEDVALSLGMPWPVDGNGNARRENEFEPWEETGKFFGWESNYPRLGKTYAASLNDGKGLGREHSHAEIAALVRAEFCGKEAE